MIQTPKDLERLLKICRKFGVTELKLATVEFKLGDMPMTQAPHADLQGDSSGMAMPSDEQLAYFSVPGLSEEENQQ